MAKETVVVVDDEPFARTAVAKVLTVNGYKVHALASGQEAINFALSESFDVLITDFRMPGGLDGLTTVRAVQHINPMMVAIIMTAHNTVDLAVQSLNYGVHGFIIKPFSSHDLLKTVQQTIERQRLLRENTRLKSVTNVYAISQALISANTDLHQLPRLATALALEETHSQEAQLWLVGPEDNHELQLVMVALDERPEEELFARPEEPLTVDKLPELVQTFSYQEMEHFRRANRTIFELLNNLARETVEGRSQTLLVDDQEIALENGRIMVDQKNNCRLMVPIKVQNRVLGVLAVCRRGLDLTYNEVDLQTINLLAGQTAIAIENGRLFSRLAKIEALREADRLRSEFVSTVSHELRTPLTSIKGYATTLLREDFKWDEQTAHEYLGIISDDCDKLMELIDNILEVSKIEAGALRIYPETAQIYPVILRTIEEAQRRWPEAQLNLVCPPQDDIPYVRADARRINQVMRNLLSNAIKYSPDNRCITVSLEETPQSAGEIPTESHRMLRVSVQDRGIGIKSADLSNIFERFYRVDNGTTRRTEGTGLGLAICRGIIEAHGGNIWVESDGPGNGSKFCFTLPVVEILPYESDY